MDKQMTPEELLKPRYKVIADFPQWSVFKHKEGDVLEKKGIHFVGTGTAKSINENEIDNYPVVIKKLEWWEDRKESEMPEYVRYRMNGTIEKLRIFTINWTSYISEYEPATEEDFYNQNK